MALYFECRISKNALLQTVFLDLLMLNLSSNSCPITLFLFHFTAQESVNLVRCYRNSSRLCRSASQQTGVHQHAYATSHRQMEPTEGRGQRPVPIA